MRCYINVILMTLVVGCQTEQFGVEIQAVAGPTGVTATSSVVGQIDVAWAALPPASKYYVYRGQGSDPPAYIASVLDATAYSSTGLTSGATYCFQVRAVFPDGSESDLSALSCATANGTACSRIVRTRKLMPFGAGTFQTQVFSFNGTWRPIDDGDVLAVNLPVEVGDRIEAISAIIATTTSWAVHMEIRATNDDPSTTPVSLGALEAPSSGSPFHGSIAIPNSSHPTTEDVTSLPRAYWLQFSAQLLSPGISPSVGQIDLVTSTSNPACP